MCTLTTTSFVRGATWYEAPPNFETQRIQPDKNGCIVVGMPLRGFSDGPVNPGHDGMDAFRGESLENCWDSR